MGKIKWILKIIQGHGKPVNGSDSVGEEEGGGWPAWEAATWSFPHQLLPYYFIIILVPILRACVQGVMALVKDVHWEGTGDGLGRGEATDNVEGKPNGRR